jgi:uncharacterized membrane protein YbhN (UPF0104 family)
MRLTLAALVLFVLAPFGFTWLFTLVWRVRWTDEYLPLKGRWLRCFLWTVVVGGMTGGVAWFVNAIWAGLGERY